MAKKEEKLKTKGEALVDFVLNRFEYSKKEMQGRHEKWREYYDDYRGTRSDSKEPWQCNYIIPTLKDVVRTKVPLYANILFSNGIKSFDIEPGEEGDEGLIRILITVSFRLRTSQKPFAATKKKRDFLLSSTT